MNIDTIKKYTKEYLSLLSCDDFLYNEDDKKRQQEQLLKAETLSQCLSIIKKRDKFDYLYFMYQLREITEQECADAIYSIWTMQEKVYNCGICKTKIIKFMRIAAKSTLLQSDIDGLSNDNMVTIYRGVDVNNYKGLSWTTDKDIAEWFAKRFVTNGDKCYVFTGKINKKERVLCVLLYISRKFENEKTKNPLYFTKYNNVPDEITNTTIGKLADVNDKEIMTILKFLEYRKLIECKVATGGIKIKVLFNHQEGKTWIETADYNKAATQIRDYFRNKKS